jgi:hypothetical protein
LRRSIRNRSKLEHIRRGEKKKERERAKGKKEKKKPLYRAPERKRWSLGNSKLLQ